MIPSILLNQKPYPFESHDFPMLIHGKCHAGASMFSVALMAWLFEKGNKILFFSARPAARDQFYKLIQGKEKDTVLVENAAKLSQSASTKAILLKSGEPELLKNALSSISDIRERFILIKNMEEFDSSVFESAKKFPRVIFSGDADLCAFKMNLATMEFKSKIFFSEPEINLGVRLPKLEKYQGSLKTKKEQGIITLKL